MKIKSTLLFFIFLGVLTGFYSCKDSEKEGDVEFEEDVDLVDTIKDENNPAIWVYDYNQDIPVKNRDVLKENFAAKDGIDFLNAQNENVQLVFSEIQGDTLFVTIPESTMLTQQMGTTGADEYLSVATFTLTEVETINYVHFEFIEGDHARPGTYNRQYYIDRNKKRFQ
jgi:hypothetical protein